MTSDLQAAADRLRSGPAEACIADFALLAQAWLAEHDPTPLVDCYSTGDDWRDPWLLSVGFVPDDEREYLWIKGSDFDLQASASGPWWIADCNDCLEIPRPKTRGDVRRLASALGIELKGDQ